MMSGPALRSLLGVLCGLAALAAAWAALVIGDWGFVLVLVILVSVVAVYDLLQRRHTLLRIYPIVGHLRYALENIRHQMRQYFVQSPLEANPFTRVQRTLVYTRAKGECDLQPFGTIFDTYAPGHEVFEHSLIACEPADGMIRVPIGGTSVHKYCSSLLNISAMSYGAISSHAVLALNAAARAGEFAHNTGEGGISEFHRRSGGDLVWQIGTGYFGCRDDDGLFDERRFQVQASEAAVKMIEVKLSQGAKPGGGGVLPASKVTRDIARARGVKMGQELVSPAAHAEFTTPTELLSFVDRLRNLAGGKPVGIKICVGKPTDFMSLAKAMIETEIFPDFITVDGTEGGTGAAPLELTEGLGLPLKEALVLVQNVLVGADIRERMRIIASGKIVSGFDMAVAMSLGADVCNSGRGMMFALGCIQARRCHTNRCPTGITTHQPWRVHGLDVADKAHRVRRFHEATLQNFSRLLGALGLQHARDLGPEILLKRTAGGVGYERYSELYPWLERGALLSGNPHPAFPQWAEARADRFP